MQMNDQVLLIVGGTGSFGNAVLRKMILSGLREVRILSRDEKKQDDLRRLYGDPRIKCYLGDVRDPRSVGNAMTGVDIVFQAAALKQVPSCEFHPMEAVKTNILGTENVIDAAVQAGVKRVVCLSTDKAVYPINAMGMSKALMEKVMIAKSRHLDPERIVVCGTRYGNVMASRGSVIPRFIEQIRLGEPITVTDPAMTRFMMTLDDAVTLVEYAFTNGRNGDIFVQKAPAATIETLVRALCQLLGAPEHPVKVIGTRHGEKLYESLLSREERVVAEDRGDYFRVPADGRDLNYDRYFVEGKPDLTLAEEYSSHNTVRLDVTGMKALLLRVPEVRALVGPP